MGSSDRGRRATAPAGTPPATGRRAEKGPAEKPQAEKPQAEERPDAATAAEEPTAPEAPLLTAPAEGVPDIVEDERRLVEAARALGSGSGPLAIDAERASGYRYGQRAYLVQLRRAGAGTWLVDPVACPDLSPIAEATGDAEWILHAATQDLPCLAELGLRPRALFDTELASRLLGLPRVGLAAVIEHYLHVRLAKEHSAVDWSTRPLPEPWLRYAALDVELLVPLREAIAADLERAGKTEWAREEFAHLLDFTGPPVRTDPWRRTSGMHKVRDRRTSAVVRELWYARDEIAQRRDVSPGRVLSDATLLELALAAPSDAQAFAAATRSKSARRHESTWLAAIRRAVRLPAADLPASPARTDAPPPQRAWADRDPVAAARLADVRERLAAFSQEHDVPVENVVSPDALRRVLWTPPAATAEAVGRALAERDVRPWQAAVVAPLVLAALTDHPDDEGSATRRGSPRRGRS